jgi:hypothetical protein
MLTGAMAQMIECLPSKYKAPSSIPCTIENATIRSLLDVYWEFYL